VSSRFLVATRPDDADDWHEDDEIFIRAAANSTLKQEQIGKERKRFLGGISLNSH